MANDPITALISSAYRESLEGALPEGVTPLWYEGAEQFVELAPKAQVVWPDTALSGPMREVVSQMTGLAWCSVISSGVDWLPLDTFRGRGVALTNGAGIHAQAVAEYAIMGMLDLAKGWGEIVRAQDRREWLAQPPGLVELLDARVLVIGAGEIGRRIQTILEVFGAKVTMARRSPGEGELGSDQWRGALGDFDWVVLIVPSTPETTGMFGAEELAAMKPGSALVNLARGSVVDQDALVAALERGHLGGAYLDVTSPEPLPQDNPLWAMPNVRLSMHLAGRAQEALGRRGVQRFLGNLERFVKGEALEHQVDLSRGY